jgi:polyhydroxybutyrate depolymerase
MKLKTLIIRGVLLAMGLPAALILTALACCAILDRTNGTIVSSGVTRRYQIYVPPSYDSSKATPVVISLHGAATWPAFQMHLSRWNDLAAQYGFIAVYPAGSGAFLGGLGRGPMIWPGAPRDVRFIADLIDKLEADYHADSNRIYVDGMSNGGGMAFELSCRLSSRIAAMGAVAGAQRAVWQCRDDTPVPTVAFHGTADRLAPYYGRGSPIAPVALSGIPAWTARVAQRNQCTGGPTDTRVTPNVRRLAYSGCAHNADVALYTIEGGGHTWPGGMQLPEWFVGPTTEEISASGLMWEFFVQHPRAPR